MTAVLVAIVILIFGFRLAIQILPPSARNLIAVVLKGAANLLFTMLFGTGHKGRM